MTEESAVEWAIDYLAELRARNDRGTPISRILQGGEEWVIFPAPAPLDGSFKINTDAALAKPTQGLSGLGLMVRDSPGKFLAAGSHHISQLLPVDIVEAMAVKEGIILAAHVNCLSAIVASDSSEVVRLIHSDIPILAELDLLSLK
ncbi:conserved hypothetical protein [Ricinus communis]|uniref:RNase H type-1 domain-containing protein n=1 Tax=Ricinus communis TaxID=3988 RepID=B9SBS4_RICCO|nr:conserved hypothetical protein [Ricinus communis]